MNFAMDQWNHGWYQMMIPNLVYTVSEISIKNQIYKHMAAVSKRHIVISKIN